VEFLHSNLPPVKSRNRTFSEAFYDLLPQSDRVDIAVGYITADSLLELQKVVEWNNLPMLNLTIGMHYLDRFTKVQYNAAMELNDFLCSSGRGEVRLVTPFRYHGKLYAYSKNNTAFAGIIGSNNLGGIIADSKSRTFESSFLIDDPALALQMRGFIDRLVLRATENIGDLDIQQFNQYNTLLDDHENVQKVTQTVAAECLTARTAISYEIPIKTYEVSPHSNLNAFFGKGRVSPNGILKPRHWYEVELIVPTAVSRQAGFPQAKTESAVFQVITDDGWSFKCKVSGDDNKNFRSEGDLKILGKWLKGRLEQAGVLKVGEPVTAATLKAYGRSSFTFTKTTIPNLWYLDFGVK